jgi:4-hydroxy-tetrahydrodipicolinate synthase
VFPAEQVAMMEAAKAGDMGKVRALMSAMYPVIRDMESGDYNQKAKLAGKRHGIEPGEIRLPLAPLSAEQAGHFQQLLDAFKY